MIAVPGVAQISELMRDARISAGAFPRMAQRDSRFRPPPSPQASYSLDYSIRNQGMLENIWAIANQLIVDAPLVRTGLDTRVALSRIMDCNPEPRTLDADLNRELKEAWSSHANNPVNCDVEAKRTFAELSACAFWLHGAHGDCSAPILPNSAIKVCEAWRMRSPNTNTSDPRWGFLGVVKDSDGKAVKYWLTKELRDPYDVVKINDVEAYDAFDKKGNQIFLHPLPLGRSSSRGLSLLAPVADLLYMQMDGQFSQIVRENIACCAMFAEEMSKEGWGILKTMVKDDPKALQQWFDAVRKTWKAGPGAIRKLPPETKLVAVNAQVSPANWQAINDFMTMALAVNLDCPALAITLNAKDANFSQFRNVVHQSKMRFEVVRQWWIPQWHKPVYEHVVRRLAAQKSEFGSRLRAYINKFGMESLLQVEWSWPEYEYIEPVKDVTAKAMERSEGMITDQQWCSTHHAQDFQQWFGNLVDGRVGAVTKYLEAKSKLLKLPCVVADKRLQEEVYSMGMSVLAPIPMPKNSQPELASTVEPTAPATADSQNAAGTGGAS